jgi:hypothetical protein
MKHLWIALFALVIGLAACAQAPQKPAPKKEPPLVLVSTKWVDQASNLYNQASWKDTDEDRGLVVILRNTTADFLYLLSNDFVLVFDGGATNIPRRPCIGISEGMKAPTDEIQWGVIGSLLRYWNKGLEAPYVALLFPAPKNMKKFSIYQAKPLFTDFNAPEK